MCIPVGNMKLYDQHRYQELYIFYHHNDQDYISIPGLYHLYTRNYVYIYIIKPNTSIILYWYIFELLNIYMCICIYICICIYTYIYICITVGIVTNQHSYLDENYSAPFLSENGATSCGVSPTNFISLSCLARWKFWERSSIFTRSQSQINL